MNTKKICQWIRTVLHALYRTIMRNDCNKFNSTAYRVRSEW